VIKNLIPIKDVSLGLHPFLSIWGGMKIGVYNERIIKIWFRTPSKSYGIF
jgi:hypothetical protein